MWYSTMANRVFDFAMKMADERPDLSDRAWRLWERRRDCGDDRTVRAFQGLQYAQEKYTPVPCTHCGAIVSYWEDDSRTEAYGDGECDACFVARQSDPHKVWETIKYYEEDQPNWSGCDYCCGPGTALDAAWGAAHRLIRLGLTSRDRRIPTLWETDRVAWERQFGRDEED